MSVVNIVRQPSTPFGCFGNLQTGEFTCCTLERPWLDNQPDISCIPIGTYSVLWTQHPIHGWVYQIMNVPNRSNILIHSANVFQQLEGCIAVGLQDAMFPANTFNGVTIPEEGVQHSVAALQAFQNFMNQQPFTLVIQ